MSTLQRNQPAQTASPRGLQMILDNAVPALLIGLTDPKVKWPPLARLHATQLLRLVADQWLASERASYGDLQRFKKLEIDHEPPAQPPRGHEEV